MAFLILCKKRVDGMALWWRCDRAGYTTDVATAGRYSKEEALRIQGIRGEDFAVDEDEIGKSLRPRTIIDVNDFKNWEALDAIEACASTSGRDQP